MRACKAATGILGLCFLVATGVNPKSLGNQANGNRSRAPPALCSAHVFARVWRATRSVISMQKSFMHAAKFTAFSC
ncbi:hypothetical protein BKA81DRAFT_354573, partial [Phyllosticta paracitricarpa]